MQKKPGMPKSMAFGLAWQQAKAKKEQGVEETRDEQPANPEKQAMLEGFFQGDNFDKLAVSLLAAPFLKHRVGRRPINAETLVGRQDPLGGPHHNLRPPMAPGDIPSIDTPPAMGGAPRSVDAQRAIQFSPTHHQGYIIP